MSCLERLRRERDARSAFDTLLSIVTGKAAGNPSFDLSHYAGEMAAVYAARGRSDDARLWIAQAFRESPAGIDYRLMRSGLFDAHAIGVSDSLRVEAWNRVRAAAARERGPIEDRSPLIIP